MLRLSSRVGIIGANPYLLLSAEDGSKLKEGWRGPMPVCFRMGGRGSEALWRVNLMPIADGGYRLYLSGQVRKASATSVGDTVTVELWFDEQYRRGPMHPMPPWFADGLERNPIAKLGWSRLAPSRQKEILRYFSRLKSTEAKQRNLRRAVHVLAGGEGRFMGRSWNRQSDVAGP